MIQGSNTAKLYKTRPDRYYPDPSDILTVMEWIVAIQEMIFKEMRETNGRGYTEETAATFPDPQTTPHIEEMKTRLNSYLNNLGYDCLALVEGGLYLGRDLFYIATTGSCYLKNVDVNLNNVSNLEYWCNFYEIPLTEEAGGDLDEAVKTIEDASWRYLNSYLDRRQ